MTRRWILLATLTAVLCASAPALAGSHPPSVGPEVRVSTVVTGPAPGNQTGPSAAAVGGAAFVAWTDSGLSSPFATTVGPDGSVHGAGTAVSARGWSPSVGANGDVAMVAFAAPQVRAARFRDGVTPVDPGSLLVSHDVADSVVGVAPMGSGFLVAWVSSAGQLRVARIAADGAVLDGNGIDVAAVGNRPVALASDGTDALLVWHAGFADGFSLRVAAVTAGGEVVEREPIFGNLASGTPSVAWHGSGYVLAYGEQVASSSAVKMARLAPNGSIQAPPATVASAEAPRIAVAASSRGAMIAWNGAGALFGRAYGADGSPRSDVFRWSYDRFIPAGSRPVLVALGSIYLSIISEDVSSADITAVRAAEDGRMLDVPDFCVSLGPPSQRAPVIVAGGDGYLAVWEETRGAFQGLYAGRLDAAGRPVDGAGFRLWEEPGVEPAVAWGDGMWLVVWEGGYGDGSGGLGLRAARITGDGVLLDEEALRITTHYSSSFDAAVASNGSEFLVVWSHARAPYDNPLVATRVSSTGKVMNRTPIAVSAPGGWANDRPAVAWNGSRYVVAWGSHFSAIGAESRRFVMTRVLDASAVPTLPAPSPLPHARAEVTPIRTQDVAIATDGGRFLVTYASNGDSYYDLDVYATLLQSDGMPATADPVVVAGGAPSQDEPHPAWNGHEWIVAWRDEQVSNDRPMFGISVAALQDDLAPSASAVVLAVSPHAPELSAASFGGATAVVYTRIDADIQTERVFARTVTA